MAALDEDWGSVPFPPSLKGDFRANMKMKAVTKAKRRATLSICGLGWLDETEIEDIPAGSKRAAAPESEALPKPSFDDEIPYSAPDPTSAHPQRRDRPLPLTRLSATPPEQGGAGASVLRDRRDQGPPGQRCADGLFGIVGRGRPQNHRRQYRTPQSPVSKMKSQDENSRERCGPLGGACAHNIKYPLKDDPEGRQQIMCPRLRADIQWPWTSSCR